MGTTAGKEVVDVTIAVEDEEMELPTTAGKEVVDVTIAVEDEDSHHANQIKKITYHTNHISHQIENDQNGRRPKWKTTKMEDDQNGRRPKWKMTKMKGDQNRR